jgi:hypothetical protein
MRHGTDNVKLHPKFWAIRGTRIYFVYDHRTELADGSHDKITVNISVTWIIYEHAWVCKQQYYYDNNIFFTSRFMSMSYYASRCYCFCFVDTYCTIEVIYTCGSEETARQHATDRIVIVTRH